MKKVYMKLLPLFIFIFVFTITGCSSRPKVVVPEHKQPKEVSDHLTTEKGGVTLTVSSQLKKMSGMLKSSKENYSVMASLVKIENNTSASFPISPEFVTLKTTDGTAYKYSKDLSEILGKSTFIPRQLPAKNSGGGIMLFEIKNGSTVDTINYNDKKGHDLTIKFEKSEGAKI